MLAYTYIEKGVFKLIEKPKPALQSDRDAIVRVTITGSAFAGSAAPLALFLT